MARFHEGHFDRLISKNIGSYFCPAERNIESAGNEPILSWHFRRATPFDTLIIVIILVAGLGVIGRSQRSAHA